VKLLSADDSVGPPHVKVGHCQALIQTLDTKVSRVFSLWVINIFPSNRY
jgi:hypothetical protein